jgi:hypothetical protein
VDSDECPVDTINPQFASSSPLLSLYNGMSAEHVVLGVYASAEVCHDFSEEDVRGPFLKREEHKFQVLFGGEPQSRSSHCYLVTSYEVS